MFTWSSFESRPRAEWEAHCWSAECSNMAWRIWHTIFSWNRKNCTRFQRTPFVGIQNKWSQGPDSWPTWARKTGRHEQKLSPGEQHFRLVVWQHFFALRAEDDDPWAGFQNSRSWPATGKCGTWTVYWSPLSLLLGLVGPSLAARLSMLIRSFFLVFLCLYLLIELWINYRFFF